MHRNFFSGAIHILLANVNGPETFAVSYICDAYSDRLRPLHVLRQSRNMSITWPHEPQVVSYPDRSSATDSQSWQAGDSHMVAGIEYSFFIVHKVLLTSP